MVHALLRGLMQLIWYAISASGLAKMVLHVLTLALIDTKRLSNLPNY
jgi:hypothetical protein